MRVQQTDTTKAASIIAQMIDLMIDLRAEHPETYTEINQAMKLVTNGRDMNDCWNLLTLAFSCIPREKKKK